MKDRRYLYLFMDEGGNFDFSANGTRFFTVTSITKERPFVAPKALADLKYELLEEGLDLDCFHASENAQAVRNRVFQIIGQHLAGVHIDSVIVEKRLMPSELRPDKVFFPPCWVSFCTASSRPRGLQTIRKLSW